MSQARQEGHHTKLARHPLENQFDDEPAILCWDVVFSIGYVITLYVDKEHGNVMLMRYGGYQISNQEIDNE